MRDFVAIDFETANSDPSSICSVGIVVVRDGEALRFFTVGAGDVAWRVFWWG